MSTPIPDDLGRLGYVAEVTFKVSPAVDINVGALTVLESNLDRANLPKAILRNSKKDGFADHPGWQSCDLQVEILVTDLTPTHVGDWFAVSMGAEVAAVTLESFSSGAVGSVTKSSASNAYDDIIRVPTAAGVRHVPVKTKAGAVATFAFVLDSAANGKPKNASETGGRAFKDNPDGAVTTHSLYLDSGGKTGEIWEVLAGAVPKVPAKVLYSPNGLLRIRWGWDAATFALDDTAGASGLADVADNTEDYISDVVSFALQDLGTPVVLAPLIPKAMEFSMGYEFAPLTGGQGVSGSTVQSTNRTGWVRRNSGVELITVTINDGDWMAWDAKRIAKTPLFFWVEFQPGAASGAVGASRFCHWKPRVKIVGAKGVKVDGVKCTALVIQVERQSGMEREYTSFFGVS